MVVGPVAWGLELRTQHGKASKCCTHSEEAQRERREAQGPHSFFENMLPVTQMSSLGPTSYRFYCLPITPRLVAQTL